MRLCSRRSLRFGRRGRRCHGRGVTLSEADGRYSGDRFEKLLRLGPTGVVGVGRGVRDDPVRADDEGGGNRQLPRLIAVEASEIDFEGLDVDFTQVVGQREGESEVTGDSESEVGENVVFDPVFGRPGTRVLAELR